MNPYANVPKGATCIIEGEVDFSHFTRPYEGAELARQIEREREFYASRGKRKFIIDKPYTKILLQNAHVLYHNPPTELDRIMESRLYTDQARQAAGRGNTIELVNKGIYPPRFGVFPTDAQGNVEWTKGFYCTPEGELKKGQKVRVEVHVFATSADPMNNGLGIAGIYSVGKPEYAVYERSKQFGPEFNGMIMGNEVPEGYKPATFRNSAAAAENAAAAAPVPEAPAGPAPVSQGSYQSAPVSPQPQAQPAYSQPSYTQQPSFDGQGGWQRPDGPVPVNPYGGDPGIKPQAGINVNSTLGSMESYGGYGSYDPTNDPNRGY